MGDRSGCERRDLHRGRTRIEFGSDGLNIFVAKLNKDGTAALFTQEIGGSADEQAYGIGVDSAGNIYLTGYTSSSNFPVVGTSQNLRGQSSDAFFMKLPQSGQIIFSNYLGGGGSDNAYGLALDGLGNLWICGGNSVDGFLHND